MRLDTSVRGEDQRATAFLNSRWVSDSGCSKQMRRWRIAMVSKQDDGLVMLVRFRAQLAHQEEVAKYLGVIVAGALSEPGCRQFELYRDQDDPLNFILYEEFTDLAALESHCARPDTIAAADAIKPMLERSPDAEPWAPVLTSAAAPKAQTQAGHVTLVRFRIKSECIEQMLQAIGGDLEHMQGHIRLDLNRNPSDQLDCMICARWASRADWEAHCAKPEFKTFASRTASFLEAPMQRSLWRPV
jgi:quinol monooxygenase YgiN